MKIAIVTVGFHGSSSSLAEALLHEGCTVDFYVVTFTSQQNVSYEGLDLPKVSYKTGIYQVTDLERDGLRRFIPYKNVFRLFQLRAYGIPSDNTIIGKLKRFISLHSLSNTVNIIDRNCYTLVNIVGQSLYSVILSVKLHKHGINVVHSLHEIYHDHLRKDYVLKEVKILINRGIKINVFSKKTANDLLSNLKVKYNKMSVIPFSLFTGYMDYKGKDMEELENCKDYILFYGYLRPYKGLEFLYETVSEMVENDFKIVVAGCGYDIVLEQMRKDKRFVIINRWINNAELVGLIKHCHFVICPYLSSSQTGITQTVFNFDKPILATRVPAFVDTVKDGENGMIVSVNDKKALANAIYNMYANSKLYNSMVKNIKNYRKLYVPQIWKNIARKYIDLSKH